MSVGKQNVFSTGVSRVPARLARGRDPQSPRLFAYLLDADDDLAQELDVRMRLAARQRTTARLLEFEDGDCDLGPWLAAVARGPGLLIIDGLVAADTRIADRTVTELLGAGDLVGPVCPREEDMVAQSTSWRALLATRFAMLDSEFAERARPWPQIAQALLRRAERRACDLSAAHAINCQPRLELRLVLFLWHLASRWGRVEPGGLRLSLPLTHRLLGQLVAAERPSVSHALGRLAHAGLVTGRADDLHLRGSLDAHLRFLVEPTRSAASNGRPRHPAHQRIA